MPVGNQPTTATINQILTNSAIQLRNACSEVRQQQTYITQMGTAGLVAAQFSLNDALSVENFMNLMANISGCYYGTVQQGGQGGSAAILFNFDNALAPLWGGQ